MGEKKLKGFTIIEVMLFLAITGLVMAVLLAGVGGSLNRERYRDAVASFHDYIQGQYSLVSNVNNSRIVDEICPTAASTGGRGTSDCTIVGRILHASGDGQMIKSAQVYATNDTFSGNTDELILTSAALVSNPAAEEYSVEWGAKLVQPAPYNDIASNFTLLIVRMPTSGVIRTYASESIVLRPADMITRTIPAQGFEICVDSNGLVSSAIKPVGINIAPTASNSAGVTLVSEGDC